ncbi:glycoside hydrolase family 88 protein [Paenibacillus sp. 1001270B_150601_E10]|uniref:glycoside hydrolase family 88 protein n=1 Tax=Paenibacillus sp. 1001270B_150601_E10 TaxID=2787079 RepID=UPI0018A0BC97|nr:glycoside hydrolase family 88 protein [Paenibacillus sp. 1001270B_150601_E10]
MIDTTGDRASDAQSIHYQQIMQRLEVKTKRMVQQLGERCPHVAGADGIYDDTKESWWTSGFWPGLCWLMYDMTGDACYKEKAEGWEQRLAPCFGQYPPVLHHDVGFQFLLTAVMNHELTGNQEALSIGMHAADILAGRFNPKGRFIRAWNGDMHGWAIIDCMMNLSLLFWASEVSKDPRYKHIAMQHADTFLQYGIREDGSACHILSFDAESGEFIEPIGGQGYGPNSAWSRGNAWALYGFINVHRHTGEARYLQAAKRIAHYFTANLPADGVPCWDFRAEFMDPELRDSSAGAIAASGLLEIAAYVPTAERHLYLAAADRILTGLTDRYAAWDQPSHEAILIGGTGHRPANVNVDVSLIYGDYYYAEAIAKLNGWKRRIF